MGLFGTPQPVNANVEFAFGDREPNTGPLEVVESLVAAVEWLENARNLVAAGGGTCCLAVCAPNPIDGAALELTIGEIAERFSISLRSHDRIFRHGRDKLLIALPHVKPKDTESVLTRLSEMISRTPFKMPGNGLDLSLSVSLGGIMMDGTPIEALINRADKAMEAGRIAGNYICMWTPDLV